MDICCFNDLNDEKIIGTFYEKDLQKTNQKKFRKEKVIKKKRNQLYVKWNVIAIHSIVGLTKMTLYKMSQYYEPFGGDIHVKVDLSNYATKADLKHAERINTSNLASKVNLAKLKTVVDEIDIDKLKPVSADLSKLSNIVNNDVVKKSVYDKFIAKVSNVDTSSVTR